MCANASQLGAARAALLPHPAITVAEVPQNDAWFRDTGPTFVLTEETGGSNGQTPPKQGLAGIDWDFNAWGGAAGGLYPDWQRDKAVARHILKLSGGIERIECPLVLEGGSVHTDGEGTLITTEECLLHPNRNPGRSKAEIEGWLRRLLGATVIIWLPRGLAGDDDTNGHVDNIACFAAPGRVLLAWSDDPLDEQYERSLEALRVLESARDARGRAIEVVKVPGPPPMAATPADVAGVAPVAGVKAREAGVRLAASYVNLYVCNGGVVMPGLGVAAADAAAATAVAAAFPGRRVVQVQTREVLLGGGNIHCVTQQQPAVVPGEEGRRAAPDEAR